MNERLCHRCGSELHIPEEGALFYCMHCGAPQIVLSEELREQAAEARRLEQQHARTPAGASEHSHPRSRGVAWKRVIVFSAAVAGVLAAVTVALPILDVLVWAWAPVAPAIVLSLYIARSRHTEISAAVGARIGLVCGAFLVLGITTVNSLLLLSLRLSSRGAQFDSALATVLAQTRARLLAQSGAQATDILNLLNIPEFRAGFFLAGFAALSMLILLLSIAGGALAGAMRGRSQTA